MEILCYDCGSLIITNMCHCGGYEKSHKYENHPFVPYGCNCFRSKSDSRFQFQNDRFRFKKEIQEVNIWIELDVEKLANSIYKLSQNFYFDFIYLCKNFAIFTHVLDQENDWCRKLSQVMTDFKLIHETEEISILNELGIKDITDSRLTSGNVVMCWERDFQRGLQNKKLTSKIIK